MPKKHINEIAAEFAVSETPLQYATLNSQNPTEKRYFTEDQLPAELAAFAFGANSNGMYGPTKEGDMYTMARVADSKMLPDSVGARHILIGADQKATADSILNALKAAPPSQNFRRPIRRGPERKRKTATWASSSPNRWFRNSAKPSWKRTRATISPSDAVRYPCRTGNLQERTEEKSAVGHDHL